MTSEDLALFIGGITMPLVPQFLKWLTAQLGYELEGRIALWASFVVAICVAIVALLATGGLSAISLADPVAAVTELLAKAGVVFALATLVYRTARG